MVLGICLHFLRLDQEGNKEHYEVEVGGSGSTRKIELGAVGVQEHRKTRS